MKEVKNEARYLIATGIAVIVFFLLRSFWWLGIPLAVIVLVIISGIFVIPEENRAVIERFAKYNRTLKPGLIWIFLPGIVERIKKIVYIKRRKILLFPEAIKIDFRDGSAIPKGAVAFVEIKQPDDPYENSLDSDGDKKKNGVYRYVYNTEDTDEFTRDQIENVVRSYLNSLTIGEGIEEGRASYDLLGIDGMQKEDNSKRQVGLLKDTLEHYGATLTAVIIDDFDLEPDLVKARGELHKRKKEEEMASFVAKKRAMETSGAFVKMVSKETGLSKEEVQKKLKKNPELWKEIRDVLHRKMALEGSADSALSDIRVLGASGIGKTSLELVALLKKILGGQGLQVKKIDDTDEEEDLVAEVDKILERAKKH